MRNLLYVSALVAVGGCLSQAKFEEKFADKYCEEYLACTTVEGATCAEGTATGTAEVECDVDKAAAKACLDGTYTCNTDFPGLEFVIPPAECGQVCGAAATGDTDAPADTDDTDAAM
jgi:hypothetical protein